MTRHSHTVCLTLTSYYLYNHYIVSIGHVGQKRLQSAVTAFKDKNTGTNKSSTSIDVEWKPYIIDPNTAPNGEDFEAYNRRRWGSSGWTNHLKQLGRSSGAPFQNWKWWPNTIKSHRLIHFAKQRYNVPTAKSNEAIFTSLYEEGQNVSLVDTLVQIGIHSLDLPDENELRTYLQSDEGENEVQAEIRQGRRNYKISGVPFFVVGPADGSCPPYGLSGAQEKETFLEIFEEISEK